MTTNYMIKTLPSSEGTWSNPNLEIPERVTAVLKEFFTPDAKNKDYVLPKNVILKNLDSKEFRKVKTISTEYIPNVLFGFIGKDLYVSFLSQEEEYGTTLPKGQWHRWLNEISIFVEKIKFN